jgi:leucyl-tRNA synthetase
MSLRNDLSRVVREGSVSAAAWDEGVETLLLLLAPIAPHVTEELWQLRGHETSIHLAAWPEADAAVAAEDTITMVIQVNGKVRDRVDVPADISAAEAEAVALASERITKWTSQGTIHKVIARPPKLVNIVVS